jgi:predicted dehydrogenase
MKRGIEFPISTMPGEKVAHVYAGPMEAETIHFLECVAKGQQPLVTPEHARMVMQVYQAADKSAEEGRPVDIPPSPSKLSLPRQTDSIKNATADRT